MERTLKITRLTIALFLLGIMSAFVSLAVTLNSTLPQSGDESQDLESSAGAATATPDAPTGSVSGSLSYPSEFIPPPRYRRFPPGKWPASRGIRVCKDQPQ